MRIVFANRTQAVNAARKHGGDVVTPARPQRGFFIRLPNGDFLSRPDRDYDMTKDKVLERASAVQERENTYARSFT